ncbi:MAG: hypothetical protein IJT73_06850 [Selenomonadaceae bacterium]|nr:hypothetical protein [Selenomonadaceae bacterium]
MKTVTNGKIILPDERGNFFIATEKFLTFDEKIISFEKITDMQNNFILSALTALNEMKTFEETSVDVAVDGAGVQKK